MTATELRKNLYKTLDRIAETGTPATIERNGQEFEIVPKRKVFRWENMVPHPDFIVGDPDDIWKIDWSKEWRPYLGDEEDHK